MDEESYQVRIDALAVGGAGVGRVVRGPGGSVGKRAFVQYSVPGELITLGQVIDKKSYIEATIDEIVECSPERVTPECPLFAQCGGCDLQHISIGAQRQFKRDMVESSLSHLGGVRPLRGVRLIGTELPPHEYRRRALLHLDSDLNIGFFRRKSAAVVDANRCLILDPRIDWARNVIRQRFKAQLSQVSSIVVESCENEVIALLNARTLGDAASLRAACQVVSVPKGLRVFESSDATRGEDLVGRFSQVNAAANSLLLEAVLDFVGVTSDRRITELFAGAGNITIPLCRSGSFKIDAVEVDPRLAASLSSHSVQFPCLQVHACSAESFLKRSSLGEIVVLDPPRAGAAKVFEKLSPDKTERIIYVSCNVATMARDVKLACQHGYQLVETRVLDMFSQTHHVETISLLELP